MKSFSRKILIAILFLFLANFNLCHAQTAGIEQQLSKIENSIWGFQYSKDDTSKRLSRIETNVFGAPNSALKTEDRIKKINESMGFETYEDSIKQAYEIDTTEADGINYPQIDALEYQMFQSTYEKENIYKRLERLEHKLFGSKQDGDLQTRTQRLKAYVRKDAIASAPTGQTARSGNNYNYYTEKQYTQTPSVAPYMDSQQRYSDSDIHIQLAGLENAMFSKTYSQDPVGLRLNRLERKIFQRDFSSDDEITRIQRLQAAANAQATAKLYEANKIQKYASTGIQLGSIILMILALIL